jgi:hypothetical protein
MAQALIEKFDLRVDKKSFEGDIFDDLRIGDIRRAAPTRKALSPIT